MSRRAQVLGSLLVCLLLAAGCKPSSTVPNVAGMTESAATAAVAAAKLVIGEVTSAYSTTVPLGCIISQDPAAGARVATGGTVNVVISIGREPLVAWSYIPPLGTIWGLTADKTSDGGFIIGGGHNSTYDMYALKLSATGAKVWDKAYSNLSPDSNHTELWRHNATGARQTADGGYILLGAGDFYHDTLPDFSYLLVKTDANGNVAWSTAYAPDDPHNTGHFAVNNQPAALQVTSDGGYVAFGSSHSGGYPLASILKTDAAGNAEFCKVINDNAGDYSENIAGGQQTQDHGYVLVGYSDDGSPLGHLALLIKLDENGDLQWSRTYQYPPDNHGAEAYCVTQTADGGYVLGGLLVNDIGKVSTHGLWITKVDGAGDQIWAHSYANEETIHYTNAICETPQGDLVAGGADSRGELAISKLTSGGSLLWTFSDENLPSAFANAVVLTDDGGCVVVGSGVSAGTVIMKVNDVYTVE